MEAMADIYRHIKVCVVKETPNWLNSGKTHYHLIVKDIRRFIEWTEINCPGIDIQARYQRMERVERNEFVYAKSITSAGVNPRVIVNDFIDIVANDSDFMLFKLALPCGVTRVRG